MKTLESLQEGIRNLEQQLRQNIPVGGWDLLINLFLAALLAYLLSGLYVRYGNSLSNRRLFARNFMMLTMTTMLIITIVKSSLALSLGLVGALSIVRFRAAIKEPEELAYLFLAIGLGLGFGADQRAVTVIAFAAIALVIILRHARQRNEENHNLHLTVSSHNPEKITLEQVVETLKTHCAGASLKRFDETKELLEADFLVEFDDVRPTQSHQKRTPGPQRARPCHLPGQPGTDLDADKVIRQAPSLRADGQAGAFGGVLPAPMGPTAGTDSVGDTALHSGRTGQHLFRGHVADRA